MSDNKSIVVSQQQLQADMQLASAMVQSGRFPGDTTAPHALVKVLAGRELGLSPVFSMTNIIVVNGRVTLGASVVAALIKRSGKYNYKVLEHNENICRIEFYENNAPIGTSVFTMDDASKAGLNSKDVWKKFPRNMLFSRSLTNGARWYCAEVFNGPIYTPDELGEYIDEGTQIINNNDDLFGLDFTEFLNRVKSEVGSVSEEDVINYLKSQGKSWLVDSKREMFDLIKSHFASRKNDSPNQT